MGCLKISFCFCFTDFIKEILVRSNYIFTYNAETKELTVTHPTYTSEASFIVGDCALVNVCVAVADDPVSVITFALTVVLLVSVTGEEYTFDSDVGSDPSRV